VTEAFSGFLSRANVSESDGAQISFCDVANSRVLSYETGWSVQRVALKETRTRVDAAL
jgi:hypothetical protein